MGWVDALIGRMLEQASTRARTESPRARALMGELQGRTLGIAVRGTAWERAPLLMSSNGQTLELSVSVAAGTPASTAAPGSSAPIAEAVLEGAPLSLLALLQSDDPEAPIRRGDVRLSGDALLAQRFSELFRLLAPDLEHSLSQLLGRSGAHLVTRGLRAAGESARRAAWTAAHNVAEYLAHESGDLVSRQEAAHVLRGVEQAREQLDRLEARVRRLEQQAEGLAGGSEPA